MTVKIAISSELTIEYVDGQAIATDMIATERDLQRGDPVWTHLVVVEQAAGERL